MSTEASKKGVHCKEIVSGKGLSGTFTADDDSARVRLFSFDGVLDFPAENPLYLVTEDGEAVSMFENIVRSNGYRFSRSPDLPAIYHQEIVSNASVLGRDKWNRDDKVRYVRFTVPKISQIMENSDKIAKLSAGQENIDLEDYEIFRIEANDATVSARYTAEYSSLGISPERIDIAFGVEYRKPRELGHHLITVQDITRFFALAMGLPLAPRNIFVSRLNRQEFIQRINEAGLPDEHQDLARIRAYDFENREINLHGSPIRASDSAEIDAMAESLLVWLNQAEQWRISYAHMFECSRLRGEISSERMVSACRWLEKIPSARPIQAFSKEVLDEIISSAIDAATRSGNSELRGRIPNALRSLSSESHKARFARLLDGVHFDFRVRSKDSFLEDLQNSQTFRGRAAHDGLEFRDEDDLRRCARSIFALEAICFLLTIKDLPISDQGRRSSGGNRFVSQYSRYSDS